MGQTSKITLYNTEGNSDKEYTIWVEDSGSGFLVNFHYGRRGGTQNTGSKTPKPVAKAEAEHIHAKIVKEKKAKGYVEGQGSSVSYSVAPASPTAAVPVAKTDSGLRPMLLTPDSEDGLEGYVTSPRWLAQEKMNGIRLLLKANGSVAGINRRGLERPIPTELVNAVKGKDFILDGELIGSTFHAFDVLENMKYSYRTDPYSVRYDALKAVVSSLKSKNIKLVPAVDGEAEKRKLVKTLKKDRKEGVVFKDGSAPYEPGRRENLGKAIAVKVKFYAEGDFIIKGWNGDKASVSILARTCGENNGSHYDTFNTACVGNVTVPAKYHDQIAPGKILRVRYLYATDADQLYQPNVDPTDDGQIVRGEDFDGAVTRVHDLKHEGKDE